MKHILLALLILSATGLTALEKAPDFRLEELDGNKTIGLEELLEKGYVILSFWATYCSPCKEELPEMNKIHNKHEDITVVAVSTDKARRRSKAARWIKSKKLDFVSLFDPDMEAASLYNVTELPTTYVIAPDGSVIYHHTGYTKGDEEKVEQLILEHQQQQQ